MKSALQLYSIKDETEKNLLEALRKVAALGYDGVEFAGYGNHSAEEIKAVLDETGLAACASHIPLEKLRTDFSAVLAFEQLLGNRRIVIPWSDFATLAEWTAFFTELEELASRMKPAGFQLLYHNHSHEFTRIEGVDLLDLLYRQTTQVFLEVDLFWLAYAQIPVEEWLRVHQEKIALLHFKDLEKIRLVSTELGTGSLPLAAYAAFAKQRRLPWLIAEQEHFTTPSLAAAAANGRELRRLIEEEAE